MKKDKKRFYLIIIGCLFLFIGIGYAYLSTTLMMDGTVIVEKFDPSLYGTIKKEAISDKDLNFVAPPSPTNGQGIYVRSGTESNSFPILYYRGNVSNNHLKFSGYCWKIVRTTETGGIKLIYNGIPSSDGSCNNTGTSSFSHYGPYYYSGGGSSASRFYKINWIGYMAGMPDVISSNYDGPSKPVEPGETPPKIVYGNDVSYANGIYTLINTVNSDVGRLQIATKYHYTCMSSSYTCSSVYYINDFSYTDSFDYIKLETGKKLEDVKKEMISNVESSYAKSNIDSFYVNSLQKNESMLEDFILCNDRSIQAGPLVGKDYDASVNTNTVFDSKQRLSGATILPTFTCSNKNDKFTVDSSIGNGKLSHPIGLLTADEATFAGSGITGYSSTSYLYVGEAFWTLSPSSFSNGSVNVYSVSFGLIENDIFSRLGFRPVISLRAGIVPTSGSGTVTNPYVIG